MLLIIFILCGAYGALRIAAPPARPISSVRAAMLEDVKKEGGARAYAAFKAAYRARDFAAQHSAAHLFGSVLYDVEGIHGIRVCDTDFNYGCFHGFIAEAVATEGIDSVHELSDACKAVERPAPCEHGIGHGLVEYLGPDKLTAALDACENTYQADPIGGCRSGVFMEFNIPVSFGEDGQAVSSIRPHQGSGMYDPCPALDRKYQQSCYYSLPQWWNALNYSFPYAGTLCADIKDSKNAQACATGLGAIAGPASHYVVETARTLCPDTLGELKDLCSANVAAAFAFNADKKDDARELCAQVPVQFKKICGI